MNNITAITAKPRALPAPAHEPRGDVGIAPYEDWGGAPRYRLCIAYP